MPTKHIVNGVRALAFTPGAAFKLSCSLQIKYSTGSTNASLTKANISLQFSIPIDGLDHNRAFLFLYDPENLDSGCITKPATKSFSANELQEIARDKNSYLKAEVRTLSLQLRKPCLVLCPPPSEPVAPKPRFDDFYRQLEDFASATKICILFDYKWISQDHDATLQSIIKHPEEFARFALASDGRQPKWSVFNLVKDVTEAPPPYTRAPSKHDRPESPCPEFQLSSAKRFCPSTPDIHAPPANRKGYHRTDNPSPKPPCSPFTNAPDSQQAVEHAIEKLLPDPLRIILQDPSTPGVHIPLSPTEAATTVSDGASPKPPCSPSTNDFDFQQAVGNAVEKKLFGMLQNVLPDARLCSSSPPFSSSPSLSSPPLSFVADPNSTLLALLNEGFAAKVEALITKLLERATDRIEYTHRCYKGDLEDWTSEERDSIKLEIEDMKADLNRMFDQKIAESKDRMAEVFEQFNEQADCVYAKAVDRLNSLDEWERLRPGHLDGGAKAELLREECTDVNAQGGHYGNALQAASFGGHIQIVKLLLKEGADVNAQGGYYGNALQAASFGGHRQVVELLIREGADVSAQGGYYGNALQAASFRGHEQVVRLLLQNKSGGLPAQVRGVEC